jgi:hypothetical protein
MSRVSFHVMGTCITPRCKISIRSFSSLLLITQSSLSAMQDGTATRISVSCEFLDGPVHTISAVIE